MLNENHPRTGRMRHRITLGVFVLLIASTHAAAQLNLDHFNGFESGGPGD